MSSLRALSILFVIVAATMALAACGGESDGARRVSDGVLEVPQSAVAALQNYAFTSEVDISSAQGDIQLSFGGFFQAPNRFKGAFMTLRFPNLDRPAQSEMIVVGERVWWREPGGEWQSGVVFGGPDEAIDPFLLFTAWATPSFHLGALDFDAVRLPIDGSPTEINGVEALPVRLDKSALIGMLDQGSFAEEGSKDPAIVRADAEAFLPDDIVIETWIAEGDLYPVRILVTMSSAGYEGRDFFLEPPFDIRLRMEITDPETDVQIEPPAIAGE